MQLWNIFISIQKKFLLIQKVSILVLIPSLFLWFLRPSSSLHNNGNILNLGPVQFQTKHFIWFSIHMKSQVSLQTVLPNNQEGPKEI